MANNWLGPNISSRRQDYPGVSDAQWNAMWSGGFDPTSSAAPSLNQVFTPTAAAPAAKTATLGDVFTPVNAGDPGGGPPGGGNTGGGGGGAPSASGQAAFSPTLGDLGFAPEGTPSGIPGTLGGYAGGFFGGLAGGAVAGPVGAIGGSIAGRYGGQTLGDAIARGLVNDPTARTPEFGLSPKGYGVPSPKGSQDEPAPPDAPPPSPDDPVNDEGNQGPVGVADPADAPGIAADDGSWHTGGTVRGRPGQEVRGKLKAGEEVTRASEANRPGVRAALKEINRPGQSGLERLFAKGGR